ncbi:hypothetical protein CHS0354_022901 [Potamilus streckersoni]|uniref:Uncharacterized protein n=1 Tax=Potamilus streckersoni TaxID=2493646 RepID=A0AAE0S2P8_9BIVA|nr:hypothetical protein CHS0354_022901 [Potamilus streckersoni]
MFIGSSQNKIVSRISVGLKIHNYINMKFYVLIVCLIIAIWSELTEGQGLLDGLLGVGGFGASTGANSGATAGAGGNNFLQTALMLNGNDVFKEIARLNCIRRGTLTDPICLIALNR